MSQALTHFAVGATVTVLVVTFLVPRAPFPRLLSLVGGAWAMVPDAYRVAPAYRDELRAVHDSPATDVFFFHRWLDAADVTDSNEWAAAALAALIVATAIAEYRQYRSLRRVREVVEGPE